MMIIDLYVVLLPCYHCRFRTGFCGSVSTAALLNRPRQREVNEVSTEVVKRHMNLMSVRPYKMSRWKY